MKLHPRLSIVFPFASVLVFLISTVDADGQGRAKLLPRKVSVDVVNPSDRVRKDVFVRIPVNDITRAAKDFNHKAFVVFVGDREIPSQYNEPPIRNDGIVLVLERMAGGEKITLTVRYNPEGEYRTNYPKRTQAELSHKMGGRFINREYIGGSFQNVKFLRVPKDHKDHSWFIRYEGPGWESDKVAYRFYLDQRNATDVFGKSTTGMVLQNVGQEGFDSYHEMQSWGMDVMKVGKSLGVGSIGYNNNGKVTRVEKTDSVTCEIKKDGEIYAEIETRYYGWETGDKKVNLYSTISIHAGARQTLQQLRFQDAPDRICTGIVKDTKAALKTSKGDASNFGYLATYGPQSLNGDDLGLAIFFRTSELIGFSEDKESHIADMRVNGDALEYYFLAAWSGEPGGVNSAEAFDAYVEQLAYELANPVMVHVR